MKSPFYLSFLAVVLGVSAWAQNLCPNPSAENGTSAPSNWGNTGGGSWASPGRTGSRCLSMTGQPWSLPYWYSFPSVAQGQPYVIRFFGKSTNAASGFVVGGFSSVRRDFTAPQPTTAWADYSYVAWVPSNGVPYLQLGS